MVAAHLCDLASHARPLLVVLCVHTALRVFELVVQLHVEQLPPLRADAAAQPGALAVGGARQHLRRHLILHEPSRDPLWQLPLHAAQTSCTISATSKTQLPNPAIDEAGPCRHALNANIDGKGFRTERKASELTPQEACLQTGRPRVDGKICLGYSTMQIPQFMMQTRGF